MSFSFLEANASVSDLEHRARLVSSPSRDLLKQLGVCGKQILLCEKRKE